MTAGRSAADTDDDGDDLLHVSTPDRVTDSLVVLPVSSADWSVLTNVPCLTGAVGRSVLLLWLDDDDAGRLFDTVDLELAASARRFALASATFDCAVVSGFFGAVDCPAGFTRDVVQGTELVDVDVTRLDVFWAVLLFTDEGLLLTGLTTAGLGLLEAVSALLGLLVTGTATVVGLDLTALDGRAVL